MFRVGAFIGCLGCAVLCSHPRLQAQTATDFQQAMSLLKEHLPGVTEAELNRAALEGLLSQFPHRASLISSASNAPAQAVGVTRSNVFNRVAYLRIEQMTRAVPESLRVAFSGANRGSNRLQGVVIDLRYAGGSDYSAAALTMDEFLVREVELADWGNGMVKSRAKRNAIDVPAVVLVNGQTAGAAELFAELVRQNRTGVIVGSTTAGTASVTRDFPLASGERLRLATAAIQLGTGSPLAQTGLEPDIPVEVDPAEEKFYYEDPFTPYGMTNAGPGSMAARRSRFDEAELMRERRNGLGARPTNPAPKPAVEEPLVFDPVLARGIDLLKGLALVRNPRS